MSVTFCSHSVPRTQSAASHVIKGAAGQTARECDPVESPVLCEHIKKLSRFERSGETLKVNFDAVGEAKNA